jgi:putative phosphoribosyl transferase
MPVGKVGAPGREELAIGAVAPGGVKVLNHDVIGALRLGDDQVEAMVEKATATVEERMTLYHVDPRAVPMDGRSAVVVDDGLATGASMRAALMAVRKLHPQQLVLAVPVAPPGALAALAPLVDAEVCVFKPEHMQAVGAWYEDFTQTSHSEVAELLAELGPREPETASGAAHIDEIHHV